MTAITKSKKATLQDVANTAKVSKSTVSQYLNQRYEYMSTETKMRIEQTIEALEYQPNIIARSLKQKTTATIGVIVANLLHRFSTEITRAIEDYCHAHDYHVIVCNTDEDPSKEKKYIDMLKAKQVDGLIIIPTCQNDEVYRQLVDEQYPVVFLDRKVDGLPINMVVMDNVHSAYTCTSHLISQGHKEIAIITPPLNISTRSERIQGYKAALLDHGIKFSDQYVRSVNLSEVARQMNELFQMKKPPTALLAGNDLVLMEVLPYLLKNNIRIPDELAVAVIDDVSFADFVSPPLTTFKHPAVEMANKAAELMLGQIKSRELPEIGSNIISFNGRLQVRKSSGG
ncbi:transcriptional regulator, LacI family [Paenibacillus sp. UNCCL117]|uniref:substrate-binding domain-containing protein n=1 Tax=unclassified Paenibacillus TaxID=185978 RepID=UPI00088DD123|nr:MULTISPECIES: substrate-binding domain-containing protein [unclassified Paenibacillus]SDC16859.1 transcriptional regulator, LacI family [Paenibacillus sp. cl123]SFW17889.1 transcriptional regulator, LacI family [Paenibacillus sp. UNCCL117]